MLNLFLVLIVILSLICVMTVIIGTKSSKKIFPMISAVCSVFVIAFAFCCMIETESDDQKDSVTKAYISVLENQGNENETEKSEEISESVTSKITTTNQISSDSNNDPNKIVYITKSGAKYHFSYFCSNTDFYECTLEEALERGLEPCSKCTQ